MAKKNKNNHTPTLEEYLEDRAAYVRDSAANVILQQKLPDIPKLPAFTTGWNGALSYLEGLVGVSDATRIAWHGYEPYPETCLYTSTSKYGDTSAKATGNKTFHDNPEKYGFTKIPMSESKVGDLIQFNKNGTPNHSAIYTGETANQTQPTEHKKGLYTD